MKASVREWGPYRVVSAGVPENGRRNTLVHLGKLTELPRESMSKHEQTQDPETRENLGPGEFGKRGSGGNGYLINFLGRSQSESDRDRA